VFVHKVGFASLNAGFYNLKGAGFLSLVTGCFVQTANIQHRTTSNQLPATY